jgi:hypothetical protein
VLLWLGPSADPGDVSAAAAAVGGALAPSSTPGLLVLQKVTGTPERFPRRPGVAARRPLR